MAPKRFRREQCRSVRRSARSINVCERTDGLWGLPPELMCRVQRGKTWYSGSVGVYCRRTRVKMEILDNFVRLDLGKAKDLRGSPHPLDVQLAGPVTPLTTRPLRRRGLSGNGLEMRVSIEPMPKVRMTSLADSAADKLVGLGRRLRPKAHPDRKQQNNNPVPHRLHDKKTDRNNGKTREVQGGPVCINRHFEHQGGSFRLKAVLLPRAISTNPAPCRRSSELTAAPSSSARSHGDIIGPAYSGIREKETP